MIDRIPETIGEAWLAAPEPLPPADLARELWARIEAREADDWSRLLEDFMYSGMQEAELRDALVGRQVGDYLEAVRASGNKALLASVLETNGLAEKVRTSSRARGAWGVHCLLMSLDAGHTLEDIVAASWKDAGGLPTTPQE